MKYFLLLIFFLPICLSAQGYYTLQQDMDSIYLELSASDGKLDISYQIASNNNNSTKNDLLNIIALKLGDADLILHYDLSSKKEKDFYYTVDALLIKVSGDFIQSNVNISQNGNNESDIIKSKYLEFTWPDATEKLLEYGEKYVLVITTKLWGIVNCAETRPAFTLNQQYPYYATAAVGASLLILGQVSYQRRDRDYKEYQKRWVNGNDQDVAQSFLDDAQKAEKTAKTLTYLSWAGIGLDAAAMIYRIIKTKKDQRLYDEYCAKKDFTWSISPSATPNFTGSGQLGATLTIRF